MKTIIISMLMLIMVYLSNAQNVNIPDTSFLYSLFDKGVDTNGDSAISFSEAEEITYLDVSWKNISSLIGIESFKNLNTLTCNNNQLTSLDVSACNVITELHCNFNKLTGLDVSDNLSLVYLDCSVNQITNLDVTKNTALKYLDCMDNVITSLDFSKNIDLDALSCNNNYLTSLDVSGCTKLTSLSCHHNYLTNLHVSANTALVYLSCGVNQITSLDLSNNTNIESLDLSYIPTLYRVIVWEMPFPPADMFVGIMGSPNIYFEILPTSPVKIPDTAFKSALISAGVDTNDDGEISYFEAEAITYLNVSGKSISDITGIEAFINLDTLDCSYNQLTSLDVFNSTVLRVLHCGGNQLKNLYVADNPSLEILSLSDMPTLYRVCVWEMPFPPAGKIVDTTGSPNVYFTTSCFINIPDANLKNALISARVDKNKDSEISYIEAEAITNLKVSSASISDMTGIEAFINLDSLNCYANQLTTLDVSNNNALKYLICVGNQLTILNVSNNTALTYLECSVNQLTGLDVSNNIALEYLDCSNNQLTSLDISNNTELSKLYCGVNQLTSLDVTNNTGLVYLQCMENHLTSLDVSHNDDLNWLDCRINLLASLDVSMNTALAKLWLDYNNLTDLDVSNNTALTMLYCNFNQLERLNVSNNIALKSLCCMDNQLTTLDVSYNTALQVLNCSYNQLAFLDISNNSALEVLDVAFNQISYLDVSNCSNLLSLICDNNQLTNLNISKNENLALGIGGEQELSLSNMPNLCEVCIWEFPFPPEGKYIDTTGSPNVYFTTDCAATALRPDKVNSRLNILPNPANEYIVFDLTNISSSATVELYDLQGKKLFEKKLSDNKQVSISFLPKGLYMYKLNNKGIVYSGKVVIE